MTIKAVLFDFDGVLVSTVDIHAEAFNLALLKVAPRFALLPIDKADGGLWGVLNGLSTKEKLRRLTVHRGLPDHLHDSIWKAKQSLTREAMQVAIRPDPEKMALFDILEHKGYRCACVSNAIRETTVLALSLADLIDRFEFVLTNEDVSQQKPSPAPYVEAMHRLGIAPRECLAIEDSPHGIESARRSGAHVLPVSSYRDVTFPTVWQAIREADAA